MTMILTQCSFVPTMITAAAATMSGSTEVASEFATPDRSQPITTAEEKKDISDKEAANDTTKSVKPATVTPPESLAPRDENSFKTSPESPLQIAASQVDSPEDKHVRFDKEEESAVDSPSSTNSQRGLVSRRGGRYASPGRVVGKPGATKEPNALEFKTFQTPVQKKDESDTVPSLCSANSTDKERNENGDAPAIKKEDPDTTSNSEGDRKPASISCDSAIDQTSPIASDQSHQDAKPSKVKTETVKETKKSNVTFSPVPKPRESASERVSSSPATVLFV